MIRGIWYQMGAFAAACCRAQLTRKSLKLLRPLPRLHNFAHQADDENRQAELLGREVPEEARRKQDVDGPEEAILGLLLSLW